jgi:predicted aspartyl protease
MIKLITIIILLCLPVFAVAQQIVVPVTIVHQGRTVQARLAVDTGATVTTIGTALADRLGIPAGGSHGGLAEMADGRAVRYSSTVVDLTVGGMTRPGIEINIMDYAGTRAVDGWLGVDVLSRMSLMTIDWKNQRISWSDR